MEMKSLTIGIILLLLSASGLAFSNSAYYPPERINCKLNQYDTLRCQDLHRDFITEDITNADLSRDKDEMFYFVSAIAHLSSNKMQASIFYTYHNKLFKMVRLKTVSKIFRPDLRNDNWVKVEQGLYVCEAGYMNCVVTDTLSPYSFK